MTYTLNIDVAQLESGLMAELAPLKVQCQAAMAYAFAEDAYNSFGHEGVGRMQEWDDLNTGYAIRYHGGDKTPTLILSGTLRDSIKDGVDFSNEDAATVSTSVPYAGLMQFGGVSEEGFYVPGRPFFPIVGDEVYEPTAQKCIAAAEQVLTERLK